MTHLFYTTQKKRAKGPRKPEYSGPPPPPNRFGIKPGYRWDGVGESLSLNSTSARPFLIVLQTGAQALKRNSSKAKMRRNGWLQKVTSGVWTICDEISSILFMFFFS